MKEFIKSRFFAYIVVIIAEILILEAGWFKPIIGFIIIIFCALFVHYNAWQFKTLGKILIYGLMLMSIPIKIQDIRVRNTGEDTIVYETSESWNENSQIRGISNEVWQKCNNYPDLKKLKVIIIDECVDYKGNSRKDTSIIILNQKEITEYSTYKDELKFRENCSDWGYNLFTNWKRCKK